MITPNFTTSRCGCMVVERALHGVHLQLLDSLYTIHFERVQFLDPFWTSAVSRSILNECSFSIHFERVQFLDPFWTSAVSRSILNECSFSIHFERVQFLDPFRTSAVSRSILNECSFSIHFERVQFLDPFWTSAVSRSILNECSFSIYFERVPVLMTHDYKIINDRLLYNAFSQWNRWDVVWFYLKLFLSTINLHNV